MENSKDLIKPVVSIPIHTSNLNKYELISIKSHIFNLKDHDIYLVIPKSKKKRIIAALGSNKIPRSLYKIHQVEDYCLKSSMNYQLLMLSSSFYLFYESYTHILIAQIDAYTFSDELLKWCRRGYHYIGAPCYKYGKNWLDELSFCGVGGFSLREIKKTLEVLEKNPVIFTFNEFLEYSKNFNFRGRCVLLLKYLITKILKKDCLNRNVKTHAFLSKFRRFFLFINEDVSFAHYLPKCEPSFIVANLNDSMHFSIDWNVENSLKQISSPYPFGAHAWFTYPENLKQWKKHIHEKDL